VDLFQQPKVQKITGRSRPAFNITTNVQYTWKEDCSVFGGVLEELRITNC